MERIYIYNPTQATYYINRGVPMVTVGTHPKTQKPYWVFLKKDTKEVFGEWLIKCKLRREENRNL